MTRTLQWREQARRNDALTLKHYAGQLATLAVWGPVAFIILLRRLVLGKL